MTSSQALSTLITAAILITIPATTNAAAGETETVATVLDRFHHAASEADSQTYFELFADQAVFIGTDAGERWTVDEFRSFVEPYFSQGRGWSYRPRNRHIAVAPDGNTAWFDEMLDNDAYGTCRGSGVLILTPVGWRIAQYHLTIPIPNELTRDFVARIRAFEGAKSP